MAKIACIADLHGDLSVNIPECDILIVAGDICPIYSHERTDQRLWVEGNFNDWAMKQPAKEVVVIPGNHDFIFEDIPQDWHIKDWFFHLLIDEGIELEGLKIWGSPWSNRFGPWAFMANENELKDHYAKIPEDTDIVISHGPMYGMGDHTVNGDYAGSKNLRKRMKKVRPQYLICGHIHEGYGVYRCYDIRIINCSRMTVDYRPVNPAMAFTL